MTDLMRNDTETDSGIIEDRSSDSVGSDSNSVGSGSNSSQSSLVELGSGEMEQNGIQALPGMEVSGNGNETRVGTQSNVDTKITLFLQKTLLLTVARAMLYPQLVEYRCIASRKLRAALLWATRLLPVVIFVVVLVSMSGAMSQLEPTNHPPQFFDPDSNIQKMLDLEGNLTQKEVINCWNCSAWYSGPGGGGECSLSLPLSFF